MEEYIIYILNLNKINYLKIENKNSLEKIYNLFKNKIFEEPTIDLEYSYYGVYYYIEKNYDLMKKYFSMAIELNYSHAMNSLAFYYKNIEKNYDLMKKYYLMSIGLNNSHAMNNIGVYYQTVEKNYDLMKKYFLMAIELNYSKPMFNLAHYYKNIEKNYDLMKKYYLMAIELNHFKAMTNLASYYKNVEKNYDLMKKYLLMAIELNDFKAMTNLDNYYRITEKNDQTFVEFYKYENKEDFISLFNYKFKDNINLDQKYYYSFLQWKSENRSNIVKIKQDILRKTNIFPKNYDEKYLNHFNKIVSLKNTRLPKDILNLIAGHLFI